MRVWFALLILLFAVSVQAENHNEKYSCQHFAGKSFKHVDAKEFNNTIIIQAYFYQSGHPNSDIFPDGMAGVTFKNCNLDNVWVPPGNTLIGCNNRQIKTQNDWDDWELNPITLEPIEPLNKSERLAKGLTIDPKDIPVKKWTEAEREAFTNILYPDSISN